MAAVLLCGLTLAGCAGQVDLSKSVTNRTTVKASASFSDETLRSIEPCKLFDDAVLASIGNKGAATADQRGYSECRITIKDPTNKDISLIVKVGEDLFAAPKQVGKMVNGLPVYDSRTSTGCNESAITGQDPSRGIVATVLWDGGDPCVAATKLIESSIKMIAQAPPKYRETPGSLVSLDPCAGLQDNVASTVLGGAPQKQPSGIRDCTFRAKGTAIYVRYGIDNDPFANNTDNPVKVDLTDKVKGAAQWKSSITPNKCQVEWVHRALAGNRGENVNVAYELTPPDPKEDICGKALAAAKSVAGQLPQA